MKGVNNMKAKITNDQLEIEDNALYNSGSIDYYEIDVEFTPEWEDLTKYAILVKGEDAVKIPVAASTIKIDSNTSGTYFLGFIGYTIEDDEKTYQISTNLLPVFFQIGAGEINAREAQDLPDPTTWETYLEEIQAIVDGAENVDIDAVKVGDTATITITNRQGVQKQVQVQDGKTVTNIQIVDGNLVFTVE